MIKLAQFIPTVAEAVRTREDANVQIVAFAKELVDEILKTGLKSSAKMEARQKFTEYLKSVFEAGYDDKLMPDWSAKKFESVVKPGISPEVASDVGESVADFAIEVYTMGKEFAVLRKKQ